jgi:hypothetical protein
MQGSRLPQAQMAPAASMLFDLRPAIDAPTKAILARPLRTPRIAARLLAAVLPVHPTLLYWLIVGCEAAFWLVLVLALAARYLLHRESLSRVLLLSLPVVDLMLLAFTAADLRAGTSATFAHGLATAYVGFTVAFGSMAVRWADQRFAHWFAAGPPPLAPPRRGWLAVRYELELWLRGIVAWIITVALLIAVIASVDNAAVTQPLDAWFRIAVGSVILWLVFGPGWSLVFFRREAK